MKTTAVIPAHNESMNITDVVSGCKKYVDSVIVVDDGSKDNTATLAEKAGAIVVKHLQNGGYGRALTYGIKNAMELGADVIITIDGDGQHNPADFPNFL
jgi:glycosyltransferase involved in cell wall biosynthesis